MARKQRRSKQSKSAKKNNQTPNTKLQQLEADILELKENIRKRSRQEKAQIRMAVVRVMETNGE
jgi:peptidoglycan hydrolase CwlO-like protein